MMKRTATSRRGFSLLELLVASVILAGGLVVILQGISLGVRSSAIIDAQSAAYRLADDLLHRAAADDLPGGDSGSYRMPNGKSLQWQLETGAYDRGCRTIRCVVTWQDRAHESTVELTRRVLETPNP